jgi:hypothetical protein
MGGQAIVSTRAPLTCFLYFRRKNSHIFSASKLCTCARYFAFTLPNYLAHLVIACRTYKIHPYAESLLLVIASMPTLLARVAGVLQPRNHKRTLLAVKIHVEQPTSMHKAVWIFRMPVQGLRYNMTVVCTHTCFSRARNRSISLSTALKRQTVWAIRITFVIVYPKYA